MNFVTFIREIGSKTCSQIAENRKKLYHFAPCQEEANGADQRREYPTLVIEASSTMENLRIGSNKGKHKIHSISFNSRTQAHAGTVGLSEWSIDSWSSPTEHTHASAGKRQLLFRLWSRFHAIRMLLKSLHWNSVEIPKKPNDAPSIGVAMSPPDDVNCINMTQPMTWQSVSWLTRLRKWSLEHKKWLIFVVRWIVRIELESISSHPHRLRLNGCRSENTQGSRW
jgi:hypothetical protein